MTWVAFAVSASAIQQQWSGVRVSEGDELEGSVIFIRRRNSVFLIRPPNDLESSVTRETLRRFQHGTVSVHSNLF
jgi:hypothetical protein